jgi:N-ethylmaleimide reductase
MNSMHTRSLFEPIRLGDIEAANRFIMSPMTRGRATREHVPTKLMETYYSQRASAGVIISEATGISRQGMGWPFAPGIWTNEQINAWVPITSGVHREGGKILCQLWHMGRVVHPSFLGGHRPVSSSATTAPQQARTYDGRAAYVEARPLGFDEIPGLVADFVCGARNAIAAGFDGVQIHASNGYLIDQFLRDSTNHRNDAYGGSVQNRVRLLREVTQGIADEVGACRTSVRLSPTASNQGCDDSDPTALFTAAVQAINDIGIAFLELREPGPDGIFGAAKLPPLSPVIRSIFDGPLVLNEDYNRDRAQRALDSQAADAISFGRLFISNPDLPHRFASGIACAADKRDTWYTNGPTGYIDYANATDVSGAALLSTN